MHEEFMQVARFDWVVRDGDETDLLLHAVGRLDDAFTDWGGPGVTACGQHDEWLAIPGLFTRMSGARCEACCRETGLPQGVGAPKNDDECRRLLGMPESRSAEEQGAHDAPTTTARKQEEL